MLIKLNLFLIFFHTQNKRRNAIDYRNELTLRLQAKEEKLFQSFLVDDFPQTEFR